MAADTRLPTLEGIDGREPLVDGKLADTELVDVHARRRAGPRTHRDRSDVQPAMTDDSDDPTLPVLARNVRRLRHHRKLTQFELARRCKLSSRTILAIEQGQNTPNLTTIELLAQAFGKSASTLLHDPDSRSTTTRFLVDLLARASARKRSAIVGYAKHLMDPPDSTTSTI